MSESDKQDNHLKNQNDTATFRETLNTPDKKLLDDLGSNSNLSTIEKFQDVKRRLKNQTRRFHSFSYT